MTYHSIPVKRTISKRTRDNKCWRGCGAKGLLVHCWCSVNQYCHYAEEYGGPQKSKTRTTIWSRILLSGYIPERKEMRSLKRGLHPFTRVVALFTLAKAQTESKCPTADEWINKMWCVYIFLKQIYTYIYIYIYSQWNIILPQNRRKSCHLQQRKWTWRVLGWVK